MKKKKLEISLSKEAKHFYNESYKTVKKDIVKDNRRWKEFSCS
jgi:hypothetical protein